MAFVYDKATMDKIIQYADRVIINSYLNKRLSPNKNENKFSINPNTFWFVNTKHNYACAYYDSQDKKYTVAVGYWDYLSTFAISFNGDDITSANEIKKAIESIPLPYISEIVPVDKKYYKGYWYTILLKNFNINCNATKAESNDSDVILPIREPGEPFIFDNMNNEEYSNNDNKKFDKQLEPIRQIVEKIKRE